jgi:hypothetical protein
VGTYIGYKDKWVSQPNTTFNITINNGDLTVAITRSDNTLIATATGNFQVGNTLIKNTVGTTIATALAQGADVIIPLQEAEGSTGQGSFTFPANTIGEVPDVPWTDSDGTPMVAPYGTPIVCNATVCPTLQEVIDANTSANIATAINNAIDTDKPDDVFTGIIPNVDNATIEAGLSLAQRNALSRIETFKIGTPVIYAANDIGSNNPGRGTDFFTLSELNPNGNYNRFELLGTNVVIDWAYRLYWTRFIQSPARTTWALHLSNSAALTLEGLTDWRLPSEIEVVSIMQSFSGDPLDYTPFNIRNGVTTGATFPFATGATSLFNSALVISFSLVSASRGFDWNKSSTNKIVNPQVALYCKSF